MCGLCGISLADIISSSEMHVLNGFPFHDSYLYLLFDCIYTRFRPANIRILCVFFLFIKC